MRLAAIQVIRRSLRRFARDTRAVAAVEFALILPFLLVLYAGSVEVSEMITADRRVNTVSGTVGDLVSRQNATISGDTLEDYFIAANSIMSPFSTDGLEQVVTCVEIDDDGNTEVIWSEGFNGGDPHAVGEPYAGLAEGVSDMNPIARGKFVIVSEAWYSYTPIFGLRMNEGFGLTQDLTTIYMYHENFYLSRFGALISLVP